MKKREDVGVELYNLQQELVRFQNVLDTTEKQYDDLKRQREDLERDLKDIGGVHEERTVELKMKTGNCTLLSLNLKKQ